MAHIDTVESNESRVETDVCLGEGGASEVALTRQDVLHPIESGKHFSHGLVVGLLLCGKTSAVHSIVDVSVACKVDMAHCGVGGGGGGE